MTNRCSAFLFCALLFTSVATSACSGASSPTASSSTIIALTVTGANTLSAIGQKTALAAVGNRSDATTTVVTFLVAWQSSNPAVLSVSAGVVTAVAAGSAVVTASYQGMIGTMAITVLPRADCSTYDASQWLVSEESDGFLLSGADGERVFVFDTRTDANNGLALYRRFTTACYVGRSNSRANRLAYITPYWLDPSGRSTSIQPEDCEPYAPSTLAVANLGAIGWALNAGSRQLLLLDTADDANTVLGVAQKYSNQCFIGRGNTRSTPSTYVLPYWK